MKKLLEINNLTVAYPDIVKNNFFYATKDISIELEPGQIVGILGESGAGKSTIGRAILGLLDPPAIIESAKIKLNNDFEVRGCIVQQKQRKQKSLHYYLLNEKSGEMAFTDKGREKDINP